MVTKNQIKLVVSLQQKKYRSRHGLFVAEGLKTVSELCASGFNAHSLFVGSDELKHKLSGAQVVNSRAMEQMSNQVKPSGVLGVFHMPVAKPVVFEDWIVAVDAVRDPGNLGTIIRLCDWFGIEHLVCSEDTVDCYNPKVLQATMGSIARVNVSYLDLKHFLENTDFSIYGAFMEGKKVYGINLPKKGILVMGNEANGISKPLENLVTERVSIPQFGNQTAESLNVATATGILLNELRRG